MNHSKASRKEWNDVKRWLWFGFLMRFLLMLLINVSEADEQLRLTRDGFLYEQIGISISDYFLTNGASPWPTRVDTVLDALYEWETGIVFYLTGNSVFAMKLLNVIVGSAVPFVVWQTAKLVFDSRISRIALIAAVFFPTQVYYSTLMVRDTQSTMAMSLISLGLTAIAKRGSVLQVLSLPVGLLLIAGLRTYLFSVLIVVIPIGWVLAFLFLKSRIKRKVLVTVFWVLMICLAGITSIGVNSIFSGNEEAAITDITFLNKIRRKMNHGKGAMHSREDLPNIGEDVVETSMAYVIGLYYFFFSVSPTEFTSHRQLMAIPEVVLVVFAIPALFRGGCRIWKHYLFPLFVPILMTLIVTIAYSGVATNGGPLMRWRLQTVNVYILVAAVGWDRHRKFSRRMKSPCKEDVHPR